MKVLMPQLGETVAEGTVANWHKSVGDSIAADEILLDVETDKVSMEIPAPKSGVLVEIRVQAGETVDVGTVLAVIRGEGEAEADADPVDTAADDREPPGQPTAPISPTDPRENRGEDSTIIEPTVMAPVMGPVPRVPAHDGNARLSPAVRRLVAEHQIDTAVIPGSGRNGRITRRDVLEFLEHGPADTVQIPSPPLHDRSADAVSRDRRAAPRPAPSPAPGPAPTSTPALAAERVQFNRIRRLTSEHMVKSKSISPHVLQAVEVNFAGVDRVRKAVRESWRDEHGFSLTYLPFIAHAVCRALAEFPHANGSVDGDALVLHDHVNLAIAVDLGPGGLVAPVIQEAELLSVTELAGAIHDLAKRARSNKLTPDDLTGGTYTLSNSGTFGTLITAPIINQPQVAILSTDGVRKKPVVIENPDGDSIAIRPIGVLAQSFDHRAIDGAYSAAFLDRVRTLLENDNWFRAL